MGLGVSAIGQGLLYGLLGIGLFLTFRILDFPDMTVEGTFPFGAAVTVSAITHGVNPLLATVLALLAGMLAGLVTGLLSTKGHIPVLLAGILVMTGLFSVNLRVMGRANLSLLNQPNLFEAKWLKALPEYFDSVAVGTIVVIVVLTLVILFLNTQIGQGFIAAGDNPTMARSLGINPDGQQVLGLVVGNGLIGLSGGLIAQNNGYADVNMGIGTIVIGLAAIIIGEVVFGELTLSQRLVAVILGSIIYRFVLLLVLKLGFNPDDLKVLSAVVLAVAIMVPSIEHKIHVRQVLRNGVQAHD
ncbi:ABC transporter permease [Lacticaseibacillus nasuensis]|uniref:Ribose xylose arabinose galactoside ABC-type transporter permease n=1 Tax=Lacticaseibacillus nasuensis JCM 17158 TaxID=1291734 RepID=A0A0R1JJV6_9LACO|nr:branched-chain amino acid ABC transporter permease [Lacticaseibacillus nasuensis]KRK71686.1 ribose xylose arabinose galactoside ABC-type transporter permease [Lacticaseibacillus nasuensis JCM 17158]MCX2456196.1 ABC transporter permease [Lacticaseibacillus nasuensis]